MAAARFPWRDFVWFACAAVGAYRIATWAVAQVRAVVDERYESIRRHQARRDALARERPPVLVHRFGDRQQACRLLEPTRTPSR